MYCNMRRQNLRIYNVWRKKNDVFFRLFICHFFDKPLFYPAAPFPPPDLTMLAVYEGIVSPSTYHVQKLKKSRCRIFLTRHFHENSGKKISKFGKKNFKCCDFYVSMFLTCKLSFSQTGAPSPPV